MISDVTVLLALIAIAATLAGALAYIAKRSADGKLLAQSQAHERAMTELKSKQSADTNLSAALLSVASAMQAQVDVQSETNKRHEKERLVADAQTQQFVNTVAAITSAETALAGAVNDNTITTNNNVNAVTELGTKFDSLKVSVEEALVEMRRGITDYGKVTSVLERVVAALNKQEHDANNERAVALLTEVTKRRKTGEHAAVSSDNENGSSD